MKKWLYFLLLTSCGGDDVPEECAERSWLEKAFGKGYVVNAGKKENEDRPNYPCGPAPTPTPSPSPTPQVMYKTHVEGFVHGCELTGEVITDTNGELILIPNFVKCE